MKPLNFDNSPCSPTSSNCVIWGGPDLQCINLCKGDSITDVVAKLATELCGILDVLNISAYDISCFNLTNSSPQTFTDLINFLIVKVCALDNGTPDSGGGGITPPSAGCPTDCFVEVAPCFIEGTTTTMNLTNYVTTIGTKICTLVNSIALQQITINSLDNRVTELEAYTPPSYTTPTMTMFDTLPSTPPLLINTVQPINIVIESFINDIWFSFVSATGDSGCLATAVSQQTVLPTDFSKVNPTAAMSAQYAGLWVAPSTKICDTINNIWACIKDLRDAPLQSPFYLYGTTTDAGNNKTTAISRNNSIHTIGYDSYFNTVRVGLGNSNIISNTAIGSGVLSANTTGNYNVGVGYLALNSNTSGNYNVAIGENALQSNQSATHNTAIGADALSTLVSGFANTAIGYQALTSNTGTDNTAIGYGTLKNNTTGIYNSAIGKMALGQNTTGTGNVAIGYDAGSYGPLSLANTNSTNCIYIGTDAAPLTAADTNQIVIGFGARGQGSNTIQLGNTSITDTYLHGVPHIDNTWTLPITAPAVGQVLGYSAPGASTWVAGGTAWNLYGTTTDAGNNKITAIQRNNSIYTIGADSYFNNVRVGIGNNNVAYNTALGYGTLGNVTTGHSNTAVGYSALTSNEVGRWNTAVGVNSMIDNIDGTGNTAIGWSSLSSNTNAGDNTAIGYRSLEACLSGNQNTAIGAISLFSLVTGIYNTAVGVASLSGTTSGSRNVALGKSSLSNLTTGSNNVGIGEQSGVSTPTLAPNTSSSNCIYIGINTISATSSDTNQIVIGTNAIGMGSNTSTIGNATTTDFYLYGNMNLKNTTAVTTASVSQTSYLPITINGVAYKLLLAV